MHWLQLVRCSQWGVEGEDVLWGQILIKGRARGSKKSKKEQRQYQCQGQRRSSRRSVEEKAFVAALARTHTMEQIYTAGCGEHALDQRKNVMKKWQQRERTVCCLQLPHFCLLLPESIIKYLFCLSISPKSGLLCPWQ